VHKIKGLATQATKFDCINDKWKGVFVTKAFEGGRLNPNNGDVRGSSVDLSREYPEVVSFPCTLDSSPPIKGHR
jgi:hypothetical protein